MGDSTSEFAETVTTVKEYTEPIPGIGAVESPDLSESTSPEMPASHAAYNIDPTTLSVDGLVRACNYYAKVAEQNPELAKAQAADALQNVQFTETAREEGKDEETIAKEQWAAMRERRKQKSKAKNEQGTEPTEQNTGKTVEANESKSSDIEPAEQAVIVVSADEITHSAESRETVTHEAAKQATDTTPQLDAEPAYTETAKDVSPSDRPGSVPDTPPAVSTTPYDEREQHAEQPGTAEPVVDEMVVAEYVPLQETVEAIETVAEETIIAAISGISMAESLPELKANGPEAIHVLETEPASAESTESITRADELEKELVELVGDFTEALRILLDVTDSDTEDPIAFEDGFNESISNLAPIKDTEPVLPVAREVADTLRALPDGVKEVVAPTLQVILEKVQALGTLEADDVTPEVIETAKEELRELVTTLFDQLDIKYETEDTDHFVAILLRLDLEPLREEPVEELEAEIELEDEGTHEIKTQHHSHSLATFVTNVERTAGRLIGKTALLYGFSSYKTITKW